MNCLTGAIYIRWRIGGRLSYRLPRAGNPWGHWRVFVGRRVMSYSPYDKNLVWWHQVCFRGRLKAATRVR